MGGLSNTSKLFGLFAFLVICFLLVGNFDQISAESKVDSDLIFDSHENRLRLKRSLQDVDNNSSPPVEEHWLSSTVNRIKRSIGNIFSQDVQPEKIGHHQFPKKYHRKPTSKKHRNKSKYGRKHRQADYESGEEDENEDGYDDEDNELEANVEGQFEEGQVEGQGQGQEDDEYEDVDSEEIGHNEKNNLDSEFSPLQTGGQGSDNEYENNTGNFENGQNGNPDDEDSDYEDNSGFGSGDGEETTTKVDHGHPRVYRLAFTVVEPYLEEYKDRNSPKYEALAGRVRRALDEIYSRVPGPQYINVISMEKSRDPFNVRITVDIDSEGYANSEEIKRAVYEPVKTIHRLGDLTIQNPEDLRFTEFGADANLCSDNEIRCNSGQCVTGITCDGHNDCDDGTDEEECVREPIEPDENIAAKTTTTEQTTTQARIITTTTTPTRAPETTTTSTVHIMTTTTPTTTTTTTTEPSIDGSGEADCRGDESVRCEDGSRSICSIQFCDGIPDCDDGGDERNCPNKAECRVGEFECDIYRCIPVNQRCDGKEDCTDGTDEHECKKECNSNEFACDEQCLPLSKKCDGTRDCLDNTDELDCQEQQICRLGEFSCGRGYGCVPDSVQCNGVPDCANGEDEANCPSPSRCKEGEYECREGYCIEAYKQCNGYPDCPTGSDEENCPTPTPAGPECGPSEISCNDGSCTAGKKCDHVFDCKDGSDEADCEGFCSPFHFTCSNGKCINETLRCDGFPDCIDRSDEENCVTACPVGKFRCNNGICLDGKRHCDGYPDCPDGIDEVGCAGPTVPSTCASNEFDCGDKCISLDYRCDNVEDCPDGRDEIGCGICGDDEFQCDSNEYCISLSKKCDGNSDCSDNSDELDCPPQQRCASNQFTCDDGTCIDQSKQCDRERDCPDASDEAGCPTCSVGYFQCTNFECIPSSYQCNGKYDCSDGLDERDCLPQTTTTVFPETTRRPLSCREGYQPCRSLDQCVHVNQLCDGRPDCNDLSDETGCGGDPEALNLKTYPSATEERERQEVVLTCRDEGPIRANVHWARADGQPLPPGSQDIRGRLTIPNVQMENAGTYLCIATNFPPNTPGSQVSVPVTVVRRPPRPISPIPPGRCREFEATCSNGDCIPRSKIRDGVFDCSDGSDEDGYRPNGCEPNEFQCANRKCILKTWKCDSDDDCGDGSDEENCGTNPPGSICQYGQFACRSNNQCIPKSYHCDMQNDCVDGSDEVGCSKPVILRPPPPMVALNIGETFEITCTAVGIPTPEIVWRLNWGHVPSKCRMTSNNGEGRLICENIQIEDQGAYSCESLNIKGATFAVPDTILNVNGRNLCQPGYFNVQARSEGECIKCFCFGHTSTCRSADLFTFQFQPPFDTLKILGVRIDPSGAVDIRDEPVYTGAAPTLLPNGPQGVYATVPSNAQLGQLNVIPYFALPENYHGNQLKSYGGYLNYWIRHSNRGAPLQGPNIIVSGNGYAVLHQSTHSPAPNTNENVKVRFFEGEWIIRSVGSRERPATREEIMMVLENVDNILIKLQYNDGQLNTTISNIEMESAGPSDFGLGPATYVEECTCPVGYSGTSCERCAEGYVRQRNGPWLGLCTREPVSCPPGMYNDGRTCQICPCPLTDASNQFGRTCHLGSDGDVVCNCPAGYVGNRCQHCAPGYEGNPLSPGDSCRPVAPPPRPYCDPAGSIDTRPDQYGRCRCKNLVDGPTCNQCKANNFYLSSTNQFGCISCFCMGVSSQCSSSNWYREQISSIFASSAQGFLLVDNLNREAPISTGIRLDSTSRQISYSGFIPSKVYYWSLPSRYQGNKLTSYGGYLRYSIKHTPIPGGQSSRNNAADVELVSKNNINLLYYNQNQSQGNLATQTFAVPILEQYWQRTDGQIADREHLLMVLADLEAIYIKATYYTNTEESSLISVSLDVASERNTGHLQRALEVEQCHCPVGYTGLSCENCDVGYTRTESGLYLGLCEPCNCNGYSTHCDPDDGHCLNCKDGTTGYYCDECLPGYTGDPGRGIPCTYGGTPPPCDCDPNGSVSNECRDGRCICKANVEGNNCDRCRPGSFGLNSTLIDGCEFCFCSGVASECIASNLYIDQIPYSILQQDHGFTLTDQSLRTRITDNFDVNELMNEIGYGFLPSNRETLYWSLPRKFTGNQIKSYGGKLEFSQRYTQRPQGKYLPEKDVIIMGNGITIFWKNPVEQRDEIVNQVSVVLRPSAGWLRLDPVQGVRPASREDMLTVLAKIEAILIRASQSVDTTGAYLSDITLDTADEQYTKNGKATSVEVCRCPQGYEGTSCESCDAGYYKDLYFDQSRPLGSCTKCPCNNREESCELGPDHRVVCHCRSEFTGRNCEFEAGYPTTTESNVETTTISQEATIEVTIQDSNIGIYEVGSTVRYNCSARSRFSTPVGVSWRKADGYLPDHAIDDGRGLLVITNLKVSDSGRYVCEANDGFSIVTSSVNLNVGVPHDEKPRIALSQAYAEVNEGQPIDIQCVGSGVPTPEMSIVRSDGQPLNPEQHFENGVFRIHQTRVADTGEYTCIASNRVGSEYARFTLVVRENSVGTIVRVDITPQSYTGVTGETVQLRCSSPSYGQSIRWSKQGGDLPYNSREDRGTLIIRDASPDVSGVYVCTVTTSTGTSGANRVTVTIVGDDNNGSPTAQVSTQKVTLNQGASIDIECKTTGNPPPSVKWTKLGEDLSSNAKQSGSTLNIRNARVEDRGVYVCVATNNRGLSQASVVVEVTRLETPLLEIHPQASQTVILGNSAVVQCRAIAGIPSPTIRWSRRNNLPLSQNVEEMSGGTLRFTQITPQEGGEYICTATNEAGTATATADIIVHTPPEVRVTPGQEVITKNLGDFLRLECTATGIPLPSVAWSKYGKERYLPTLLEQRSLPNVAYQEFTRLTKEDEGLYVCKAESSAGIVERRVQLIVDILPSRGDITGEDATSTGERPGWKDNEPARPNYPTTLRPEYPGHDQELTAAVGARVEIRCRIENRGGVNIQVRWSRTDGSPLPSNAFERNGVLYMDNLEPEAQGEYRCTGYDQSGTPYFNYISFLTVISPPRITLIPPRQIVHPGENAYINCSATGEQPIDISWSPVNREMPQSVYTREGYIRFNNIQHQDAGTYLCTARNRAGSAEAVAEVIVEENVSRPAIKAEQKQQRAPVGTTVTLRCRASSPNAGNSIKWFRERLELPVNSQQTGEVLYLRNVQPEDQGRYYCEIQTREGTFTDYVDLQLTGPSPTLRPYLPQPDLYISPPETDHYAGEKVEINCQSSERGAITVWSKVSGPLSSNVENVGGTLRIINLMPENAGVYRCEATGRQGPQDKDYVLTVLENQYKDEPPLEIKEEKRGSTVLLRCNADFEATEYVWSKQGGELPKYVDEFAQTIQLNDIDGADAGTYTCTASNSAKRKDIPIILVVTGIVPYFTQAPNSYITLPTLSDSYMKFNFEISFRPHQDTGLILYNGNKGNDISGDFISLALVDSVPEFKYNLGMGTTSVRSNHSITMGDWHTIKISRNRRKVTMYVDGDEPFTAVPEGKYTGLDLTEPMYLGGVPDPNNISPEVNGYTPYQGFVGCISRFKVGHAHIDILREALNKTAITTCETCSSNKCQNQGACQEALSKEGYMCICPSGFSGPTCNKLKGEACSPHACGVGRCIDQDNGFECQCPIGYAGRRCEREINVVEPAFQNDAYIAYPTPKLPRKLKLTLKVKPNSVEDGILLYCSESEEGYGNFLSLAVRDRHLEFRYDAGNGVTVIRDENELRPGEWHVLTATRSSTEGRLMIDGQAPSIGRLPGNYKPINLQTPLYVGGYDKHHVRVSDGVQVSSGFNGCISDINLAGIDLNIIQDIADSSNVRDCSEESENENSIFSDNTERPFRHVSCSNNPCQNEGQCYPLSPTEYQCACATGFSGRNCEVAENICDQNPCQNQGICRLTNSQYSCDCPLGFTGRNCDQATELRSDVHFDGNGFLEFSRSLLPQNSDNQDVIALEISTNQSNGLVFWHGQTPDVDGSRRDFIALAIQNGYLEYTFDLGDGPAVIRNQQVRVNDGDRHSIILKRNGRRGSIEVDHTWVEEGESQGLTQVLEAAGNIYIGGTPNISTMTGNRFTQGFNGCIHGFELQNSQRLDLGFKAINGLNVKPCSSFSDRDIWSNDLVH